MKRGIGSVLCIAAILLIVGSLGGKPDTREHRVQDWAMVGVLLAIGIPLSLAKKKEDNSRAE